MLTESEELELLELEEQEAMAQQPTASGEKQPDLASTLYHGALEGGAMAVGGAAGAILGSPGGPIGSAVGGVGLGAAMYAPAKRFAEGIDRFRGITPPPPGGIAEEYGEGLAAEAGARALGPLAKGIGKILPGAKTGEMISGTPKQNLSRAYEKGFTETYLKPKRLAEASEKFGDAKFKMVGDALTPDEQVAMMVNPKGEANQKVAEVMTKWLKNEPITAPEALAAKQGADTIFPPDVAKKQAQRGGLAQFKKAMNEIIARENPEFAAANADYAASKLRADLSKPMRVNKTNPDQYSKLGWLSNSILAGTGNVLPAVATTLGTSPLAMGLTSSIAGSVAKTQVPESVRRMALAAFIDKVTTK